MIGLGESKEEVEVQVLGRSRLMYREKQKWTDT